ncbi:hypothetical protein M0802_004962 [Mischocyttarus mexicanus]|nr:hypothetical protein M0802_004962 [Mischocyttarus mexicanus]
MNDAGKHFPILGICLGFELLTYVAAGKVPHRTECSSQSQALPLNFDINYVESNLFKNASPEIIEILSTKKVTINFHHFCITDQALRTVNLNNIFRVTSRNFDTTGIEFISSLEHKDYPFYGLQFHPEKNLFEWVIGKKIPHGFNAIKIGQYFANFFVNEARKNDNQFRDDESEVRSLIYNYNPFYTGSNNKTFQQIYLFPKN